MRALDDESDFDEADALEKRHEFIERTAFDADLSAIEMEEAVAADEEYLRIHTELRLVRDGIKHDFAGQTGIDLDDEERRSFNQEA